MAPELFWDGLRTPAADVYSAGLVLYSVYNYGRLPFWPAAGAVSPNDRAGALQKRMSGEEIVPPAAADQELSDIILRALSFRTEERWQDAQELKDALSGCSETGGPADISLVISGLIARGAEPMPAGSAENSALSGRTGPSRKRTTASYDKPEADGDDSFATSHRRVRRRGGLSWLWIVILLAFIGGSLFLLLRGCSKGGDVPAGNLGPDGSPAVTSTPDPTPTIEPTASPTPEVTATPEPTATPDGPRYVVYKEDVSWSEAVALCEEKGGWLAYPSSDEDLEQIKAVCDAAELEIAWMGASRKTDGSWRNARDGVVTYFFWVDGTGEPSFTDGGDGAAEDYMMLWKMDGKWCGNDSREDPLKDYYWSYTGRIGYVCQFF